MRGSRFFSRVIRWLQGSCGVATFVFLGLLCTPIGVAQAVASQTLLTTQVPALPDISDGVAYELGMKFQAGRSGQVTALRYWKAASDGGSHVGTLWSSAGVPLASVTFTGETASGWQQQALATPVAIQPNTTYVVSVTANSNFADTNGGLASAIVNGDLSSVADGSNGVFGSPGAYPTGSWQNSNYFRDVVFIADAAPTITKVGGDNQSGSVGTTLANSLVVQVKNASGNPQSGTTVTFGVTAGGGSVSPASAVTDSGGLASTSLTLGNAAGTNTVHASASGIGSVDFNATASVPTQASGQTIFTTQVPAATDTADGVTYELGMKFRTARAGQIVALRHWKSPSETGTHIGRIWSANGALLTSVTFLGETASGWQTQNLSTPLHILANTTYVVSVNVVSHYPFTASGLAASIVNGDLSSVADGSNGVYGTSGSFPSSSFQNGNYFRDIVFAADNAPSIVKTSGDNQGGNLGATLPNPLVVLVRDGSNNPLSGATVNFAVTGGSGSVSPASAVTDASGHAGTSLTLGTGGGVTTVTATAPTVGSVNFTAIAGNAIYFENQKPGTPDFLTFLSMRYTSTVIAGYTGAPSVNRGGSLSFKVSTPQPGPYTIDVYRLGYYGGTGGRLVTSSGSLNGATQAPCAVTNQATLLVECNWSTSYTLSVGADWVSGLYLAKLVHTATGKEHPVFFVVRDDASNSKVLFQSSRSTALAYNSYGTATQQYSLYGYNSTNGTRALKVSLDRPSRELEDYNALLIHEFNMAAWLESQGYDVSYTSNFDVHTNPASLLQHKAFLSVGHDEYWSKEMRDGIEQARDAGVNLGFFSANTAYWRVRFEPSSTGVPNRVMVCYKDPVASPDPIAPTYTWRDPLNNRPENALLGIMYIGDGTALYGGYNFVVANNSDPYYANTGVSLGTTFSQLVGYEWDGVVNNGFTPPGLVVLGSSPVTANAWPEGDSTHTAAQVSSAARYTAASGAKVFSTGTIQWMWGLNSIGVNPPRVDARVQQMTVNVLSGMGAKPLTPSAGIIVP